MSDQLNTLSNTVHNATPNPNPLLNKDSLVENMLTYQSTGDQPTGSQDPTGAQGCCNSVPSLNSLKRNKDSLLNLDTQKNKLDDLVGSLVIILDHQPISTIVNSQQLSSHQQEQTLPQSSKQLESLLLTRITLPTKENSHHIA
ncbi:hypothetical protein MJO29_012982 [Puccinia striiformis f. sp. tritici]|nr:hypothetical protein MJO29_012982 [Puccinia striiformis f. sp. tritici]